MVKNHCLAKSINDASWYQFRIWLEYFGKVFEKVTVAVIHNIPAKNALLAVKLSRKHYLLGHTFVNADVLWIEISMQLEIS